MAENETDSANAENPAEPTNPSEQAATGPSEQTKPTRTPARRAASRPAGPPPAELDDAPAVISLPDAAPTPAPDSGPAAAAEPKKATTRAVRTTTRASRAKKPSGPPPEPAPEEAEPSAAAPAPATEGPVSETAAARDVPAVPGTPAAGAAEAAEKTKPARTRSRRAATPPVVPAVPVVPPVERPVERAAEAEAPGIPSVTFQPPMVVFQPPQPVPPKAEAPPKHAVIDDETEDIEPIDLDEEEDEDGDRQSRRRRRRGGRGRGKSAADKAAPGDEADEADGAGKAAEQAEAAEEPKPSRSRKRGGKAKEEAAKEEAETPEEAEAEADEGDEDGQPGSRRRRRRRRRSGTADGEEATTPDDPPNTVVHVRDSRTVSDEVQSVKGSTRLEAKKQRRREGREQGRRRPPVITESEFLARRESVERVMVIRQQGERTQIAVLEDDVLVEHYVDRASHQSYVGNVYLGKVQNVLPSMEAAFVDIGKGRNAVLYAGEVNWDVAGLVGQPRRIESALKSGQSVLVQVTKDPLGHKGARLTSQVSLPGRYLVYVPDGSMTGISRKLPDKERSRLKQILKKVMPENAGVIVRTAAEGATEEELSNDVSRLAAQWENIQRQAKTANAPALLHGEPDLTIRVVRDIFNEDFSKLVVAGEGTSEMVAEYVRYVAPHLADRVERWEGDGDVLSAYRIDEQIAKALERKVWLPSGGSLVIDKTEAMTVVDVNTGKFTGQGGNLEETVTRNNLEAAEEIVRQLRLRDIGGIIVIDFIDMVLEYNRDLVMRRLLECLSRDRTKHQVAEVTSLGLVQMTRKRVGQGLLEAFSEVCECCNGRGIHVQATPVEHTPDKGAQAGAGRRRKRKGEVEKVVEDKIARHESEQRKASKQAAAAAAEADPVEDAQDAAVDVPPTLDDSGDVVVDGAEASAGQAEQNGRRRRPRRSRAKADPEPASAEG